MRNLVAALLVAILPAGSRHDAAPPHHSYLFVWAGDSAQKASDFLAVIDAEADSPTYGRVVASVPTGASGRPHHTEDRLAPDGHLLANDFELGRTWLFDLTDARRPRVLASFGDEGGFSHPHSFVRLRDGSVLSTYQYLAAARRAPTGAVAGMRGMPGMKDPVTGAHATGGLVKMDERGNVILARSAVDPAIRDHLIYPYSVLPIAALDLAVSTTTDMDGADSAATSQWVQFWRLSDLKLLHTVALPPGPLGKENLYSGEPRLLPDGHSVYIHTFNCGLYLIRNVASDRPTATFVHGFEGTDCGVPILTSHYWLQTVPAEHALVALDITDPAHPREVSRAVLGADEHPHWVAIDPTGRRIVLNSAGNGSRLFIIDFDPGTGKLAVDQKFRDAGSAVPGLMMRGRKWPNGFAGTAVPHGSVFSR